MTDHESPLTCCDRECAAANDCIVGGIECERCHRYFCANEICDNGMCEECDEEHPNEEEENEQ